MKVVCIFNNNRSQFISIGKEYDVISSGIFNRNENSPYYEIMGNNGRKIKIHQRFFKSICEKSIIRWYSNGKLDK